MKKQLIHIILGLLIGVLLAVASYPSHAYTCRSSSVKHKFDVQQGYPSGRFKEGFVVDHICALECGGIDSTTNMQYQTVKESKAKDYWERTTLGCKSTCTLANSTSTRKVFNCKY